MRLVSTTVFSVHGGHTTDYRAKTYGTNYKGSISLKAPAHSSSVQDDLIVSVLFSHFFLTLMFGDPITCSMLMIRCCRHIESSPIFVQFFFDTLLFQHNYDIMENR